MDLRIESATIKEEMQVRWVCETGMVDNMARLVTEFVEAHNLKVSDPVLEAKDQTEPVLLIDEKLFTVV